MRSYAGGARITLGGLALLLMGCTALGAATSAPETLAPEEAEVADTVRRALTEIKTVFILPDGVEPGKVSPDVADAMLQRARASFTATYTGDLLASRLAVFQRQVTQMRSDRLMSRMIDGGIRRLVFTNVRVAGDTAMATGTYTGRLREIDPQSAPNEVVEIANEDAFTMDLVRLPDGWRIASQDMS